MVDKIQKFFNKLDKKTLKKIKLKLLEIQKDPFHSTNIKKIKGKDNTYRVRIGKIRIIYVVIDNNIDIIDIDYRGSIY